MRGALRSLPVGPAWFAASRGPPPGDPHSPHGGSDALTSPPGAAEQTQRSRLTGLARLPGAEPQRVGGRERRATLPSGVPPVPSSRLPKPS